MKKVILLALILLFPFGVDAKVSLSKKDKVGDHEKLEYSCLTTPKPSRVGYVDVKPSDQNNGRVILRFGDSGNAHMVRIKLWYKSNGKKHSKTLVTGDNGWVVIEGLKNGKKYSFKIRGESNCGVGRWSEKVQTYP